MAFGEIAPYLEATALGLLVGLERDWAKRASEPQAAGVRTFAVVALAGAAAAASGTAVVAAGAVAIGILVTVGYARTADADRGITTETAALATFLLGALVRDHAALAVGAAVVLATVLAAKAPIHHFTRTVVSQVELTDALRFLVAAFVLLPLAPDRNLGPYGALDPFKIWLLVVTLTGIGWVGYIAVRALGADRGLPLTGFAGGFVSAAAVSATLARVARNKPELARPALAGALLASAATLLQLSLVLSVANRALLKELLPATAAGVAVIAVEAGFLYWRSGPRASDDLSAPHEESELQRPFRLAPALVLAAVLTAVTLVARWASAHAGATGAIGTAALAGFADAHAPSLAVATLAGDHALSSHTALIAIGFALTANTVSKCVLATGAGGHRFGLRFTAAVGLALAATLTALASSVSLLS